MWTFWLPTWNPFSASAFGVCGTDSSREVNECHCISEQELFHAITLKVYERIEWKERERERKRAWENDHNTSTGLPYCVWKSITLTSPFCERCRQITRHLLFKVLLSREGDQWKDQSIAAVCRNVRVKMCGKTVRKSICNWKKSVLVRKESWLPWTEGCIHTIQKFHSSHLPDISHGVTLPPFYSQHHLSSSCKIVWDPQVDSTGQGKW